MAPGYTLVVRDPNASQTPLVRRTEQSAQPQRELAASNLTQWRARALPIRESIQNSRHQRGHEQFHRRHRRLDRAEES
jgi:hypothetical protein